MGRDEYLEHHGILGQKWGIRRFQNKDGSLKPAGQKRYNGELSEKDVKRTIKAINRVSRRGQTSAGGYDVQEAVKSTLKGKISLDSLHQKKKELEDFLNENADARKKAHDEIYNKADKNIDKEIRSLAKKYDVDVDDNVEWLQEEAWDSLMSKYTDEYDKTPLGKKEREMKNSVEQEYKNIAEKAVGEYGGTSLKNVYNWTKDGKVQAHLDDVIRIAVREIETDYEYEKGFHR